MYLEVFNLKTEKVFKLKRVEVEHENTAKPWQIRRSKWVSATVFPYKRAQWSTP